MVNKNTYDQIVDLMTARWMQIEGRSHKYIIEHLATVALEVVNEEYILVPRTQEPKGKGEWPCGHVHDYGIDVAISDKKTQAIGGINPKLINFCPICGTPKLKPLSLREIVAAALNDEAYPQGKAKYSVGSIQYYEGLADRAIRTINEHKEGA